MRLTRRACWVLGGLWLLLIALLSLAPLPAVGPELPQGDKLKHALAYVALSHWFVQLLPPWRCVLGLFAYGLLIEILQAQTTSRQAEVLDLVANLAGIALGLALMRWRRLWWMPRAAQR